MHVVRMSQACLKHASRMCPLTRGPLAVQATLHTKPYQQHPRQDQHTPAPPLHDCVCAVLCVVVGGQDQQLLQLHYIMAGPASHAGDCNMLGFVCHALHAVPCMLSFAWLNVSCVVKRCQIRPGQACFAVVTHSLCLQCIQLLLHGCLAYFLLCSFHCASLHTAELQMRCCNMSAG